MTTFKNSVRSIASELKEIASELDENVLTKRVAERLLEMSRHIVSHTLSESVPDGNLLRDLSNLLAHLQIEFAVIGGVAVNVRGQPRGTDDVDALVSTMPDPVSIGDPLLMEKFGFYRAKSHTGTVIVLDHRKFGQAELLLANNAARVRALHMATTTMVLGMSVPVVTAEALVALKLQAVLDEPKRMTTDGADIASVALANSLDRAELGRLLTPDELMELNRFLPPVARRS